MKRLRQNNLSYAALTSLTRSSTIVHSGGLVVSVLAFYSDNPSSNPASNLNFLNEKAKINEKEAGVGSSLKNRPIMVSIVTVNMMMAFHFYHYTASYYGTIVLCFYLLPSPISWMPLSAIYLKSFR